MYVMCWVACSFTHRSIVWCECFVGVWILACRARARDVTG